MFFHDGTSLPLVAVATFPLVHKSRKKALICLISTLQAFLKVMRVCMVEFVLCIVWTVYLGPLDFGHPKFFAVELIPFQTCIDG